VVWSWPFNVELFIAIFCQCLEITGVNGVPYLMTRIKLIIVHSQLQIVLSCLQFDIKICCSLLPSRAEYIPLISCKFCHTRPSLVTIILVICTSRSCPEYSWRYLICLPIEARVESHHEREKKLVRQAHVSDSSTTVRESSRLDSCYCRIH
jgi:hypothetical protein